MSPQPFAGGKNLGTPSEVDLCLCFCKGLYNGFDTESFDGDHAQQATLLGHL